MVECDCPKNGPHLFKNHNKVECQCDKGKSCDVHFFKRVEDSDKYKNDKKAFESVSKSKTINLKVEEAPCDCNNCDCDDHSVCKCDDCECLECLCPPS
jgi:hypothetical protein